ncbi:coniferyl aldehyde dehydrogenase [Halioxenophilus sp. WMMB6]|uniref:coniferyl aldehyde dehydrogenase n=1 Tax=Halioxenophilus sp. WMMB6 TaxID=3073815 RepID=UPI00295EA470|nr:coniferyl aldehyde dehydrogenase [Halioxenophilus sp. WMMB6]
MLLSDQKVVQMEAEAPTRPQGTALEVSFDLCRTAFMARPEAIPYHQRIAALDQLQQTLLGHRQQLIAALNSDFNGRSAAETLQLELFGLIDEIRYTKKHLRRWMKPKKIATNALFQPSRSRLYYQPLGVIGIIGSYNYPLLLTLSPLIGALAAGNHAMIKPSTNTPATSQLLQMLLSEIFSEDYVAVVTGSTADTRAFSSLPFDHLIFTGSTNVGRKIMAQAAANLTPVTLELGGKSPTIIAPDYPLAKAIAEIVFAKFINAGQTCVAPDYLLVHEKQLHEVLELCQAHIARAYPRLVNNPDYTRLINGDHFDRLQGWLNEATAKGAKMIQVNNGNEACSRDNQVFPPTLIWYCPDSCALLQEEIFGPILPIVTYRNLDEAIAYVNKRDRPLALYYFDNNAGRVEQMLNQTLSGGVTINGCVFHVAQHELPFGGVGASGMGQYHGFHSFETFSKKRGVFFTSRFMNTKLLKPPYGKAFEWVMGSLLGRRLQRERLEAYRP